jgi:tetrahydromethanopterin S-methyltransferase subunit G
MLNENNVNIYDYLNTRLNDLYNSFEQRFESNERQVDRAERFLNERLASVNEFRLVLSDQQKLLVNRTEYKDLIDRVDRLESRVSMSEGRGKGISASWGYLVGAVGLIVAFVTIFSIDSL